MGCFDIFCIICGNSCYSYVYEQEFTESWDNVSIDKIKKLKVNQKMKWLNKCTMLLKNNKVIHGVTEVTCGNEFQSKTGQHYIHHPHSIDGIPFIYPEGLFMHTDCWKFIKKEYNVKLTYGDLPLIINPKNTYKYSLDGINYGKIADYWSQCMEHNQMIVDDNIWMSFSPLDSTAYMHSKNISRIKKIVSQLKINKDAKRVGPNVSATFYKNGDIKLGNNGSFWIKKAGRWVEMDIEIEKRTYKFKPNDKKMCTRLAKISSIGEENRVALFINDYITSNNVCSIDIIGDSELLEKLDKIF